MGVAPRASDPYDARSGLESFLTVLLHSALDGGSRHAAPLGSATCQRDSSREEHRWVVGEVPAGAQAPGW
jgi:hypothetical protein